MPRHPLLLDVAGRRVVVVGGGPVAARRVARLVDDGADVLVVAPRLCEDLADLDARGLVRWTERGYAAGDLDGAWLVHTATGEPSVDDAVA
ncbi:NAD(P)-dependent oxidoreductase, partial [Cellulomonas septica]